ncbi:MAG: GDP-mannose pyrophosphatase NudK [Bacteroidota bacterium]
MNPRVKITEKKLLSDNWYELNRYTFDYQKDNGEWEEQIREAYDRGNGATILLYNKTQRTVILTRQFRLPTYVNGNPDGLLIEACAGLLDKNNAEDAVRKEAQEETGYQVQDVEKIFEAYMSPGSVTEIVHFFIGEYTPDMKTSEGGGLAEEQENIEVIELLFEKAFHMIQTGEIKDAKTIMLLQHAKIQGILD